MSDKIYKCTDPNATIIGGYYAGPWPYMGDRVSVSCTYCGAYTRDSDGEKSCLTCKHMEVTDSPD
ncbi:MAG: hypothetical protein ACYS76_09630 [Planctomycetota bacterium]|jgi:hypothetical protein